MRVFQSRVARSSSEHHWVQRSPGTLGWMHPHGRDPSGPTPTSDPVPRPHGQGLCGGTCSPVRDLTLQGSAWTTG